MIIPTSIIKTVIVVIIIIVTTLCTIKYGWQIFFWLAVMNFMVSTYHYVNLIEKVGLNTANAVLKDQNIEDDLGENITETYLQIDSLTFKEKNKWKFSYGESAISALILDEEFSQHIDSGELRFGKGDLLKVKLRRTLS